MSSLKPVIHGRDHLPGGADPIPATPVNSNSAEEHLQVETVTVTATDSLILTLASYAGTSIVDLSGPTHASIITKGVYAASAAIHVFPPATEAAGDGIDFSLLAVQSAMTWPPSVPSPSRATFVNKGNSSDEWFGAVGTTRLMDVNDWFQLSVVNFNSYDIDVIAGLSIVRIIEL